MSIFDFKLYLGSNILMKNDRSSMLASLETRAPFLDKKIIDFAVNKLPDNFKIENNQTKSFLKEYSQMIFPKEYKYNSKRGFNFTDEFVANPKWIKYFRDIVHHTDQKLFNKEYVDYLINNIGKGDKNNFNKLYSIIILLTWITKNKFKIV
jgi:asparagine synthase (glutamine-hydrolysing)